ncbi:hypothetical protein Kpho01_24690 [Kitasatospora phosalacinea]|uniref:Uncharacterized protein n=1 Tax=Kitasatospora phosalacinea TaxID=2065 RepID=A0A9W6PGE9_9ACTN|nr:hypothetical protein [Kitasatospora phosalacinea]GLW54458.1 hypothetical protein Kpho01_24690 [Kitasatospora phosalacinea]
MRTACSRSGAARPEFGAAQDRPRQRVELRTADHRLLGERLRQALGFQAEHELGATPPVLAARRRAEPRPRRARTTEPEDPDEAGGRGRADHRGVRRHGPRPLAAVREDGGGKAHFVGLDTTHQEQWAAVGTDIVVDGGRFTAEPYPGNGRTPRVLGMMKGEQAEEFLDHVHRPARGTAGPGP